MKLRNCQERGVLCSAHPVVQYPCGNSPSQMLIIAIALHKMARTPYKNSLENSQKTNSSHPKHNNPAVLLGRQAGRCTHGEG